MKINKWLQSYEKIGKKGLPVSKKIRKIWSVSQHCLLYLHIGILWYPVIYDF